MKAVRIAQVAAALVAVISLLLLADAMWLVVNDDGIGFVIRNVGGYYIAY